MSPLKMTCTETTFTWDYELEDGDLPDTSSWNSGEESEEEEEDDSRDDDFIPPSLYITKANVTGFATQKNADRSDIEFIVQVTWSDGRVHAVKRSFHDFCNFQLCMLDEFNRNASLENLISLESPFKLSTFLPESRKGKDDNISLAEERELQLNRYVQELIKLPLRISASPIVLTFFESRNSDPKPCAESRIDTTEKPDQYMLCWM